MSWLARCCRACSLCWLTFGVWFPENSTFLAGKYALWLLQLALAFFAAWVAYCVGYWFDHRKVTP